MSEHWIEVFAVLGIVALMLLLRWMDRVDARLKALEDSADAVGALPAGDK